jgi:phosphate transport system permease protein
MSAEHVETTGEDRPTDGLGGSAVDGAPFNGARHDKDPQAGVPVAQPRHIEAGISLGDKVFRRFLQLAGLTVLLVTGAVGLFLFGRAFQALNVQRLKFLTTQLWQPDVHRFGIAAVLTGTVLIALVAIVVSTPLAIATALWISEIAPDRIKRIAIALIDLMFAIPSVVFGLWGLFFFQGHLIGVARWLATWLAWIPVFKVSHFDPANPLTSPSVFTASTFIAGMVVALMIAPIQCSIMREVFSQAPAGEREGALALGATRWGMIRTVVLPFGKGGMIGATMLALGRALGETIAVVLIISPSFKINLHILHSGAISVSSLIEIRYSDSSAFALSALFAAGLALFLLTLVINFTAATIVARSRSGAQSE